MLHYPSFKKIFSIIAFLLLMGCPCIACEEIPVVKECLHHCEKKRSSINGSIQHLKQAISKLLRTIISAKALALQNVFEFFTSSLPTPHFNHSVATSSSTILLL
jgi:hypothetical protein